MTLTEFLLARIAEDEANIEGDWADGYGLHIISTTMHERMVRECKAKRRIVELHDRTFWASDGNRNGTGCASCHELHRYPDRGRAWVEPAAFPCATLRTLAAVYADHRDYGEAWRP